MADASNPAPRILFIARSCDIRGMFQDLVRRSETYYCSDKAKPVPAEGTQLFTWAKAWELRRRLRESDYDLVITSFIGDTIWRVDQPWWKNVLKLLKKIFFYSSSLGPNLVPWMMGRSKIPLAIFDWEDNYVIPRKNWGLLNRATCYFKTQTPRNPYKAFLFQDKRNGCLFNIVRNPHYRAWAEKIRPYGVGATLPPDRSSDLETPKVTDIFFAGAMGYSWVREEGRHHLEELKAEGYRIDLHCLLPGVVPLPPDEFLRRCAQAWLVWSPEGAGWDCMRHYWAPLMGSVPLLNHPDTRRHQPLLDGVHAFYYGVEGDDIKRVVRLALQDKDRLKTMAQEARAHVMQYHTHRALGDYMVEETMRNAAAAENIVLPGHSRHTHAS